MGLIRGFLIATAIFLLARPASIFFTTPGSEQILRIIGISIIIHSFNNVAVLYFYRELQFHKFFKYQFLGTIADVTVTVTAAFFIKSAWALLIGLVAGNLMRCIMSYVIEPYRPRIQLNKSQVRELYRFSIWISATSILVFLITHGDDIFVGKVLGAAMLGFYQMAYKISNTPTTEISQVVSQVSFPAYSKLQDNLPKLRDAFIRILKLTAFISFPLASFIFVLAPEFTLLFLGAKWLPVVAAMQILVIAGAIRSLIASACSIFRATGKPKTETIWQIIRLSVIIILIYPLTVKYGISGTSTAILISTFIAGIGFFIEILKVINCGIRSLGKLIILPLINGLAIGGIMYALKFFINAKTYPGFFLITGTGVIIFFGINYLFDKYLNYKILLTIKEGLYNFRK